MPRILVRRATATVWTATNPVLGDGELAFEHDTGRMKVGDGMSTWTALTYLAPTIDAARLTTGVLDAARIPDLSSIYALAGSGSGGGVTAADNGDGSLTLTIDPASSVSVTPNGDGSLTLTI